MKTPLIIISVVVLVVAGWLLISKTGQHLNMNTGNNTTTQAQPNSSTKFDKAPDFHLQDFSGKTVSLSDFAGKPIVINSWAAWCPFCRKELVDFVAAQKEFGDKVSIIAVDRAETRDIAKKYTDELGVTGDMIFLLDLSDSFYQSIGGFSMPETIFVDSNGNIVFHKRGPMDVKEIRTRVKELFQL
ncbi:MAG: TlpA family protein disulfide reductase [Candidatus Taylorbacteria bacterium]|nr:TlpA family protein disulfide reductase [Candidatus Taylorbacteria bacterium]